MDKVDKNLKEKRVIITRFYEFGDGGGGVPPVIEPKTITENGTYAAPEGVDGFSPVTVNTPPLPLWYNNKISELSIAPLNITQNGTYNGATAVSNPDGTRRLVVNHGIFVNVPPPKLYVGNFTTNGNKQPTAGNDGFSEVNIDVPIPPQPTDTPLTITDNGVTNTPAGVRYTPITVDIPPIIQSKPLWKLTLKFTNSSGGDRRIVLYDQLTNMGGVNPIALNEEDDYYIDTTDRVEIYVKVTGGLPTDAIMYQPMLNNNPAAFTKRPIGYKSFMKDGVWFELTELNTTNFPNGVMPQNTDLTLTFSFGNFSD